LTVFRRRERRARIQDVFECIRAQALEPVYYPLPDALANPRFAKLNDHETVSA
jgi:hypothetical protein